jgi:hypothetical protein
MLMSIMLQRQLQDDLDEHTHPIATHDHSFDATAETVGENELPVATSSRSGAADPGNMGLLFLPMMMGQGDGRDGGDEGGGMMAMAMMMALSK